MPNTLFTAISGLNADQDALGVIGNNIANSNTIGFKNGQAQFEDLMSQSFTNMMNGAGEPFQIGLGTTMSGVQTDFEQGALQTTGVGTNAAIVGNGMFILNGSQGTEYTRAGNFTLDQNGFLVNPDGLRVQGFNQKDANGNIITSGATSDIQVPVGITSAPTATTTLNFNANLDASAPAGTVFNVEGQVYDSVGGAHTLTMQFTRGATGNSWTYTTELDGNSVTPATTGTVSFDANGNITSPAPNGAGSPLTTLTIPGQTLADGGTTSGITLQLVDANGKSDITGFDAPSATTAVNQNGNASGTLTGITIGSDGTITGAFTNGTTESLGQIATASFNNYDGLTHEGSNLFAQSAASGTPTVGAPGTGARGSLTGGSIESSNVDLPTEFSNMIIAERGFQSNSRVITTTDQMIQDIMAIIR